MSFQPGRMGIAEGLALVFFSTFAAVFLSIWSKNQETLASAAWAAPIMSFLGSLLAIWGLVFALERTGGDLISTSEQLLGVWMTRLFTLFYAAVFFLDAGLLLRQFAENTLLTALHDIEFEVVIAWYALLVVILVLYGIEAIARACYLILPASIAAMIVVLLLLYPQFDVRYLMPWTGPGIEKVLVTGLMVTGFNIGAVIPFILAASFQNLRTVRLSTIFGLGISVIVRDLGILAFTMTFGAPTGREKVLPFFEMARLVYISRFIQRIESFFILLWAVAGVLNIAIDLFLGLYLLSRLFKLAEIRPFVVPVALIVTLAAMMPDDVVTVLMFHNEAITTYYNLGAVIIPLLLFVFALIRGRKVTSCGAG